MYKNPNPSNYDKYWNKKELKGDLVYDATPIPVTGVGEAFAVPYAPTYDFYKPYPKVEDLYPTIAAPTYKIQYPTDKTTWAGHDKETCNYCKGFEEKWGI